MKGKKIRKILIVIALITVTSGFSSCSAKKSDPELKNQETWLTVFVHGIISIAPVLSIETMGQIQRDQIENTMYELYVTKIRQDKIVRENQAMQELGLKKIDTTRTDTIDGCPALAKLFDKQYEWINPDIKNHYYTFGWSGFMTPSKRYNDAKKFYKSLNQEIKKFHDKGIYPKTRLIGFSHGGSVCLNLAAIRRQEHIEHLFDVDELILLGMPVIENSYALINDPIFKKICNFYSDSDKVQILDFSQPGKLFSSRKFKAKKNFTLPDNLLQVKLDLFRHIPLKSGWGTNKKVVKQKKRNFSRHSKSIRKSSPGHCEWWFFGWTNKYYRDSFAIAPLPIVAILPTITTALNNSQLTPEKNKKFGNQIKIEIRPFVDSITLRTNNKKEEFPFLPNNQLTLLQDTTKQFPFKKVTDDQYNQKIENAIKEAKATVAQHTPKKPSTKKRRKHRRIS